MRVWYYKDNKNRETKNQRIGGTVQRKIKLSSGTDFYMTRKYKNQEIQKK